MNQNQGNASFAENGAADHNSESCENERCNGDENGTQGGTGKTVRMLIANSDAEYSERLANGFREQGYLVDKTTACGEARNLAVDDKYDLIVVGRHFSDGDGVQFCRQIRRQNVGTPTILLAPNDDDTEDAVNALDAGADDYLDKHVEFEELAARARAMLRRCEAGENGMLQYADLEVDVANRNVRRGNRQIILTPREFALLEYLVRNRERVCTRTAIGDRVWGLEFDEMQDSNVVDVYVSRLRRKIRNEGEDRSIIVTVPGAGYTLNSNES